MPERLRDLLLIFVGGGLGSVIRVMMDVPELGPWMPANFLACFLMGFSSAIVQQGVLPPSVLGWWKALMHTGFLGGLSTFSVLSIAGCMKYPENVFLAAWWLLVLLAGFFVFAVVGFLLGLGMKNLTGRVRNLLRFLFAE
ncbi:CrcB family protein [Sutterella sp.]|uniref:fluoride efflux transporter FluC n=1 Tax=Sutterella sp. TaxID=1981025 RepID=UPI0026E01527|nr:CrcB family protein [Sutterella sp.]MDO5532948.1 CrcB family protein [Sutterella sp.]